MSADKRFGIWGDYNYDFDYYLQNWNKEKKRVRYGIYRESH